MKKLMGVLSVMAAVAMWCGPAAAEQYRGETKKALVQVLQNFYNEENGNRVTVYSMRGLVAEVDAVLRQNIAPPAATATGPAVGPPVETGAKEDITGKGIKEDGRNKP